MRVRKVLNSLTFRYIAKYLAVLTASVFVLLAALYSYFSYNYFGSLNQSIIDEIETLQSIYEGQSMDGLTSYIDSQYRIRAVERFSYLVLDEAGGKVLGDLAVSPRYKEFSNDWLGFELTLLRWGESVDVDFLARRATLDNGFQIMVARDYEHAVEQSGLIFRTLFRAMTATLILGLIGGFFSASSALRRVERLNQALAKISRGNPGERLNIAPEDGYVGELSMMMNSILDQMETLMLGVRRVSDNIAHDLRTPLTRIRNQLSRLRTDLADASAEDVDGIIQDCDELLTSFNALLRISTLETGKRSTVSAELDLGALLRDVVELYEPLAQEKNVCLTLEAESRTCRGEADLLSQMFANILDNAVKYTPPNGSIEVVLEPLGERGHSISVADSGPGIGVADRKNVFRRFYRVESSRSEYPGHGLGLSLVQAIAQYHNGSVYLSPNNPGLRVRIYLP